MTKSTQKADSLLENGRYKEAEMEFLRLCGEHPDDWNAHFGLATALRHMGRMGEAAAAFKKSASQNPGSFAANFNAGMAFFSVKDYASAYGMLTNAVGVKKDFSEAYRLMGLCLAETGSMRNAIENIGRAVALEPGNARAWYDLANLYRDAGMPARAEECFTKALSLKPEYVEARTNLGELYQALGLVEKAMDIYEKVVESVPQTAIAVSNLLLCLNHVSTHGSESFFKKHVDLVSSCFKPHAQNNGTVAIQDNPGRRMRIGYVSPDFRTHSVAYFLEGILENHDRKNFEIFCYSNTETTDGKTEHFMNMAKWRDIFTKTDKEACERIMSDSLDILVDLAGHTAGNRLGIFALRPAPVQVTYMGYPNTSGLKAMDYRITDCTADPPESDEYYTEKLVRLSPGFLCYRPEKDCPDPEPDSAGKNGTVVFGSFNNPAKISTATVGLWAKILEQVDNARLFLKYRFLDQPMAADNIREKFIRSGIDPRRIDLAGRSDGFFPHMECYNRIDVALDTFPYNGTTTTCEALWMGAPVITLAGDRHSSRVGASLLKMAGLDEFIAETPETYVSKAKALVSDKSIIAGLKTTLRKKMAASGLCASEAFTRKLETAFRSMAQETNWKSAGRSG